MTSIGEAIIDFMLYDTRKKDPREFCFEDTILITHKNCTGADGAMCEILFRAVGGKKDNVFCVSPNSSDVDKLLSDLSDDMRDIIIADVSVSVEQAERLNDRSNIILFDHHKTAIPLRRFDWCNIEADNKRCGSKMFYDWLYPANKTEMEKFRLLVDYIDDYDRWQLKLDKTHDIHDLYEILGIKDFIKRFADGDISLLYHEEQSIKDYRQRISELVETKTKKAYIKQIGKYKYGFVFSERFPTQIGKGMLENLEIDVACIVSPVSVSFRSKVGVDASEIAKINGGGGHAGAAGVSLEKVLGKSILNLIIDELSYPEE